jgi:predicted RNase H-like HicB family nuclease
MRVSAVLTQDDDVWLAYCEEVDRTGEGRTADEAVASLREALREYFDVEAVAPPKDPPDQAIEIIVVDSPTNES